MLLALIILWLVVVAATSVWVALCGRRLVVTARAAQVQVERYVEESGLEQLPAKLEELQRRQAVLTETLARLQTSIAEFMVLYRQFDKVRRQVMGARGFFTK